MVGERGSDGGWTFHATISIDRAGERRHAGSSSLVQEEDEEGAGLPSPPYENQQCLIALMSHDQSVWVGAMGSLPTPPSERGCVSSAMMS